MKSVTPILIKDRTKMRFTLKLSLFIICLVFMGFFSSTAFAQDCSSENIDGLWDQAVERFHAEDFYGAADALETVRACEDEPDPLLFYNLARAYQQAGRCVLGSYFFRAYLNTGDDRAQAQVDQYEPSETECANLYQSRYSEANDALSGGDQENGIRLLQEAIGISPEPDAQILLGELLVQNDCDQAQVFTSDLLQNGQFNDTEAERIQALSNEALACQQAAAECSMQISQCEADQENSTDEGSSMVGYIVTGIGGAVLLGAIIHDISSQSLIDDYELAAENEETNNYNSLREDIDAAKGLSWALYGVGAATLTTGIILTVLGGGGGGGDVDCSSICWDFGVGSPSGLAGGWFGGRF